MVDTIDDAMAREVCERYECAVNNCAAFMPSQHAIASMKAALAAAPTPSEAVTYSSTQSTDCAGCGKHKHTPLRIDAMGGYVCLTCIDQKLGALLGEFGYPQADPAPSVAARRFDVDVERGIEVTDPEGAYIHHMAHARIVAEKDAEIAALRGAVTELTKREAEQFSSAMAWKAMTKHAEARAEALAGEARDAARLDALQNFVDANGGLVLHNGDIGGNYSGLGLGNTSRTLRQAIDQMAGAPKPSEAVSREHDGSTPERPRPDGSYGWPQADPAPSVTSKIERFRPDSRSKLNSGLAPYVSGQWVRHVDHARIVAEKDAAISIGNQQYLRMLAKYEAAEARADAMAGVLREVLDHRALLPATITLRIDALLSEAGK